MRQLRDSHRLERQRNAAASRIACSSTVIGQTTRSIFLACVRAFGKTTNLFPLLQSELGTAVSPQESRARLVEGLSRGRVRRSLNTRGQGSRPLLNFCLSFCWESPPMTVPSEREPSTSPEQPHHPVFSSPLSSISRSRSLARSAEEPTGSLSSGSLSCLSSSSRCDVRSVTLLLLL
jgi:hypothetical protein